MAKDSINGKDRAGSVALGNLSDPEVTPLNLIDPAKEVSHIQGATADLIRDGYDAPLPWFHNLHADPADRRVAFLIGRGWSATRARREKVAASGLPVMAVNYYQKDDPRPDYWCSGDGPVNWPLRIWEDGDVMKFAAVTQTPLLVPREDAYEPPRHTTDMPNVNFFHQVNNLLDMDSWLFVPYIAWGTSLYGPNTPGQFHDSGAARSSMLIGLRLLWHLGYREVYLLGCDCSRHQHPAPNYWRVMFHIIDQLGPVFRRWGYSVYQTNPAAHLRTFPIVPFDEMPL